jgi:hypothetical protein
MSPPIIGPDERPKGVKGPILLAPGGLTNTGFLIFPVRDALGEWHQLSVELSPSHMRVIAVLDQAMREDRALPWEARGWRRVDKLAALIERLWGYPLEQASISSYLSAIRRSVRDAARRRLPAIAPPQVIEHHRGLGARLAWPDLRIIDDDAPRPAGGRSRRGVSSDSSR